MVVSSFVGALSGLRGTREPSEIDWGLCWFTVAMGLATVSSFFFVFGFEVLQ